MLREKHLGFVLLALLCSVAIVLKAHATGYVDRSSLRQAEQNMQAAMGSEQRGDSEGAMSNYMHALAMASSATADPQMLRMLTVGGMKLGELCRRTINCTAGLLNKVASGQGVSENPRYLIDQLQNLYGRMQTFEPQDPTWYYLDAAAYSANGDYRAGYLKLQECLHMPGGDASVRQKAQSLMAHIKPGYDAQQQMFVADRRAYEEYVSSGKQALDFAIVGATQHGNSLRDRGDVLGSNMAYSRASQLGQQRMQLNKSALPDGSTVPFAQINANSQSAAVPPSPTGGNEADKFGARFFEKYAFGPLHVKRVHY